MDPSKKEMYTCKDSTVAKQMMSKTVEIARKADWKHSECPEELESLQLLCQFLHSTGNQETRMLIEWVFSELEMDDLLAKPSQSI